MPRGQYDRRRIPSRRIPLTERMWNFISPEPNSGCWLWEGGISQDGYALVWANGTGGKAHRMIYEEMRGPVPDGLQLDHLCRVRFCVNPDHLEPVTQQENVNRGLGSTQNRVRCVNGHDYTEENTVRLKNGYRKCRTCSNSLSRKYNRLRSKKDGS